MPLARPAVGLVAGALGKKQRREAVADALMGFESAVELADRATHPQPGQPSSLKPWLDLARAQAKVGGAAGQLRRWHDARTAFKQRLAEVDAARARLAAVQEALDELPQLAARRAALHARLGGLERERQALVAAEESRLAAQAILAEQDAAALAALQRQHEAQALVVEDCRITLAEVRELQEPGLLTRLLKKLVGMETAGYRDWKARMAQVRAAFDTARAALQSLDAERARLEHETAQRADAGTRAARAHGDALAAQRVALQAVEEELAALASRAAQLEQRIASLRQDAAVGTLPDGAFLAWPAAERHRASLWVTASFDTARTQLFLAALALHQATLMADAGNWFKALGLVRTLLCGGAPKIARNDLPAVWQALFFVMPVVSTTLASFGRLFQGMGPESLGWVLIDEAGQAPPAAVAGALYRARRAVVVGDPLQIEPVVTAPRRLVEQLGRHRGLDDATIARWSPSLQSAQRLADRTMRHGALVEGIWSGLPLRTHRRCMSPMFEVANRIAYGGQMVQATLAREVAPNLAPTCWIDVRGEADGKVVHEEIVTLRALLRTLARHWPQVADGKGGSKPASVYVISPFRDVTDACAREVGQARPRAPAGTVPVTLSAGTVHTFQGKEASIVFLVLGTQSGSAGAGAREWAAAKPNLLNVAVTRAQQRLYVIGSHADWSRLPHFMELCEQLPVMRLDTHAGAARLVPAPTAMQVALACR
ncbi:DEAD/DEAH box helicase [Pseudoduganella armeniaca]|uniref:DNA2/NAM7 helicase-like C-terminal domain-containing protein n=1 Tax=Pseudoduganella armeniaca TaxID=2072590 RepID=A0A2R4CFK1_9BURK|nr:DEAD/DEAH box helicase [Pseudoduganella armeniaca]AVR98424.1 hypothetical protein C9I28_24385 [Pseudoduganella armeniaca]